MQNNKRQNYWQQALKFISRCPNCNTNYKTEEARLFAKTSQASLVHITCDKCYSAFMAMVISFGPGISSVGMLTDLNYDDALRLHKSEELSVDELIDGHLRIRCVDFINNFNQYIFVNKR